MLNCGTKLLTSLRRRPPGSLHGVSSGTAAIELIDAVIQHLEAQRAEGVRWVPVRPETLASLSAKPASRASRAPGPVAATQEPPASVTSPSPPWSSPVPQSVPSSPTSPRAIPGAAMARWARSSVAPANPTPPPPSVSSKIQPLSHPPLPPPLDPASREAALAELRIQALACTRCPNLVSSRKSVVFGVGTVHARLLFVGEAPGADEDLQGEPFVGKAGELLTRMIGAMGLSRADVYIANILKCRPDTPGQTSGNRKPTTDEMATCIPWLHQQVNILQPGAIVALGATAVEGLLGKTLGISKLRGSWQDYRGIPLMPTYHPAYLLRNQAVSEKRKVWEDLLAVMERLELPINAKQRGYFLSKA